jgi:hypothetical protein
MCLLTLICLRLSILWPRVVAAVEATPLTIRVAQAVEPEV